MKNYQKTLLTIALILVVLGTFLLIVGGIASAGEIGRYMDRQWEENMVVGLGDYTDSQEGVESLDVDVKYGEVRIITGDAFRINGSNIVNNNIKSYMNGSTWVFRYQNSQKGWSFFNRIFWRGNGPRFEITIPEGFQAKDASFVLGAGTLDVEDIIGDQVTIEIGAGKCRIESMNARESLKAEVGAGELEIYRMDAVDARMNCGAGRIYAEGKVMGDSKVDCGLGEITMNLIGNSNQYNYTVDCGLGQVRVNDDYYNVSASVSKNNQANNKFQINCGVGQVNFDIYEGNGI